jgi:hypothetical protein
MNQLEQTLSAFDQANTQDPNTEIVNSHPIAKELIYGQRMSAKLNQFLPQASIELQLAARCQHICRWKIPRSNYSMDRKGYKKWRLDLAVFHGDVAAEIILANGFSQETSQRVKDLLLKRDLKRDSETQALEDIVCLVFLEFYLDSFAKKHDEAKLLNIIQKTWNKMSEAGHLAALKLPLSETMLALVSKALKPQEPSCSVF